MGELEEEGEEEGEEEEETGMSPGSVDLEMGPLRPDRYPPTRATASEEESSSQRPSVARMINRNEDFGRGLSEEEEVVVVAVEVGRENLRWVTTGRAVT